MKRLVKWGVDYGRMGDLEGIFVLNEEEWKTWKRCEELGVKAYAHDVLGKHSEVRLRVCEEDYEVVETDQDFIDRFEKIVGGCVGFYPLYYLEEALEEEEEE